VLSIDKILQRQFPLRTALQLQKHVIHRERIRHLPAVVLRVRFTACVPGERVQPVWIDRLRNENPGRRRGPGALRH
jgi:hypothetical protein